MTSSCVMYQPSFHYHCQVTCCVFSTFDYLVLHRFCTVSVSRQHCLMHQHSSTLPQLQVHYLQARPPGDQSGITLRMTRQSTFFSAGMINYAKYFTIPPGKPQHPIENQCCYSGFEILKGFAFRVHTHALGRCAFAALPPALPALCFFHFFHHEGLQAERTHVLLAPVCTKQHGKPRLGCLWVQHMLRIASENSTPCSYQTRVSVALFYVCEGFADHYNVLQMLWLGKGTTLR